MLQHYQVFEHNFALLLTLAWRVIFILDVFAVMSRLESIYQVILLHCGSIFWLIVVIAVVILYSSLLTISLQQSRTSVFRAKRLPGQHRRRPDMSSNHLYSFSSFALQWESHQTCSKLAYRSCREAGEILLFFFLFLSNETCRCFYPNYLQFEKIDFCTTEQKCVALIFLIFVILLHWACCWRKNSLYLIPLNKVIYYNLKFKCSSSVIQASRLREEVHNMGSINMSEICTELKKLRSLVRVCEIQATLREQR